jgi:hypothetical protein
MADFVVYEICVAGTLLDLELTITRVLGVGALTILIATLSAWFANQLFDTDLGNRPR